MPPEFYGQVKRIRDNTIQIDYKSLDIVTSQTRLPKPYGVDGPVTGYIHKYIDSSGTQTKKIWVFAGMRRGGRTFYAIDVTDPVAPSLKWRKGCTNQDSDSNCSTGFSGIGQTWSSLRPLRASGYGAGKKPLLIAGGGYDKCEDSDPNICTAATKGNKIYVLDADTGAPLKTMSTDRAVIADVFIVEDADGLAKYAYAVDLGGNLYRITTGAAAPADWTIKKIASLGCNTVTSCVANRKFMFAPDIVEDNGTYILLIGSGDREKPITSYTSAVNVQNHFFMIKDKPSDTEWLASEAVNCGGAAIICKNSLLALPSENTAVSSADLEAKKGWYLNLRATEQVATSAITVFGVVTFSTHQPSVPTAGTCSANLGTARTYNMVYATGTGRDGNLRSEMIAGGGLPPSPIAGRVTLDEDNGMDGGRTVPFIIGAKADSPLESREPPVLGVAAQPKSRVYWYIRQ
jgi:type IV pilus assembly protein PilY1